MIDLAFSNTLEPKKGLFLLSDPFLNDDYFRRSIIFLCEHSEEGSFGFVLNNFLAIDLHELDVNFPDMPTEISLGGPVEPNSLYFMHTLGEKIQNSVEVENNIYLGGDFQQLSALVKDDPQIIQQIRFFIGYSSWSAGQLKEEIEKNSWIVVDMDAKKELFESNPKPSWKEYMTLLGGKFKVMSDFPIDPQSN